MRNLNEATHEELIDLMDENGYSAQEIAAVVSALDYDDFDNEDISDFIDTSKISSNYDNYYEGTIVTIGNNEYLVFEDYDDVESAVRNSVENLVDEIGIVDAVGEENLAKYIDEDICKDALIESMELYCEDIWSESDYRHKFDNRLVQECYDKGYIDDDDFEVDEDGNIDYENCTIDFDELRDRYVEGYENEINDWVEEYIWQFGKEGLSNLIKHNPQAYNIDSLVDDIIANNEAGNELSSYDGYEREADTPYGTYYVYRTN